MTPVTVITAGGPDSSSKFVRPKKSSVKKVNRNKNEGDDLINVSSVRVNPPHADKSLEPEIFELVNLGDDNNLDVNDPANVSNEENEANEGGENQSSGAGDKTSSADKMTDKLINDASASLSDTSDEKTKYLWLAICFFGIMFSFVLYGLLLEYATSGGRKLHELSFLFITSFVYTITAAGGRYVRDEKPTTIPPARFAILGITSMGSTFCSVRSLRFVIYPIQVLAKSCKPVPVMLMGAFMGKKYPLKKYVNVLMIVAGVGLFMGGGENKKHETASDESSKTGASQIMGIILLSISLCFDGGTGAYEDKLMSVHEVGPFDLMYNIQMGKTILAGVGLVIFNQVHIFLQMVQDMGFLLVALGLSGAIGQVFIFVTIAKFGALTCSIIGLARKVTTLVASIYFYGHVLTSTQTIGLVICVTAMVMNFAGKGGKKGHGHDGHGHGDNHGNKSKEEKRPAYSDEVEPMLENNVSKGDVELGSIRK